MPTSQTTKEYFEEWHPYDQLIKHNYMRHREMIECLSVSTQQKSSKGLSILELGCGNAYVAPRAFDHLKDVKFTGIDISAHALEAARENLKETAWDINLILGDIETMIQELESKFDMILAGFSLHHFSAESIKTILEHSRRCLKATGQIFVCDIVACDCESKVDFLQRLIGGISAKQMGLNPGQLASISHHIEMYDFPLDLPEWRQLVSKAGFTVFECVYRDELEKYAVMRIS
jgi:ubiquinone/menaquinone biosynthesis C-methylase UbiE